MCELIRNRERAEVVQYTAYTFIEQVVFISQSPPAKQTGFLFSSKISLNVWLGELVSAFFVLVILVFTFTRNQRIETNFKYPCWNYLISKFIQTEKVLFKLSSIYLRQCKYSYSK